MKRMRLYVVAVPALFLAVLMTSCGQTYHLQSIVLTPPSNSIEGISNYGTFTVTAQLSNGKTEDVTSKAHFALSAPTDVSPAGQAYMLSQMIVQQGQTKQIQATGAVCTWSWYQSIGSDGKSKYEYATDPFTVTVTFEGQTAQGTVSANTVAGCYDPATPAPDGTESGSGLPL